MNHRAVALLAATALLAPATSIPAQRTWIVDARGGPGFHFRDLPPAFSAAAHGDTILVRPGTYSEVATGKAVRVLGGTGVQIAVGLHLVRRPPALTVSGIPAGRSFVMKGVRFPVRAMRTSRIRLAKNPGSVVLEDVQVDPPGVWQFRQVSIEVAASPAVSFNRVRAFGLKLSSSTVALSDCTIRGLDAIRVPVPPRSFLDAGTSGILASASTLILAQCRVNGGNGFRYHNGNFFVTDGPHPALSVAGGRTVITGDASSYFKAGGVLSTATPALSASGGSLIYDPNVALVPNGSGPRHRGFTAASAMRLPSLTASAGPPGGKLQATLFSPSGHGFSLFASGVRKPLLLAKFGQLWLDPGSLLHLASGVQGPTEHHLTRLPIPNLPALRGLPLTLQGLSGASLAMPGLTTPTHVVIH